MRQIWEGLRKWEGLGGFLPIFPKKICLRGKTCKKCLNPPNYLMRSVNNPRGTLTPGEIGPEPKSELIDSVEHGGATGPK